jgi:hypothetical protein
VDVDLEVVIEGVTDARVEKEIKRRLRRVSKGTPRSGEWSVFVAPSETRGEWDLLVKGPFGSHISSFIEQADRLPEFVSEQLRTCLSAAVNA